MLHCVGVSKDNDGKEANNKPKKERVLHTRVPAVLDAELKRLAGALRVPVSNVVRAILEDAVETVDAVGKAAEDELRTVADRLRRSRSRGSKGSAKSTAADTASSPATPPLAGVVGFQPMLVARAAPCGLCGRSLERATPAFLAIREQASSPLILCEQCIPFSQRPKTNKEDNHE